MKRFVWILIVLLIATTGASALSAGSEDDAIVLWSKRYARALKDLRYGNSEEKLLAALLFGGHRKATYVRAMGDELLRDMEPEYQKFLKFPTNDPFVKTTIAWAIGRTEHEAGVPYLLKALDITIDIMKKDREALAALQKMHTETDAKLFQEEIAEENKMRKAKGLPDRDPEDRYRAKIVTPVYDRPGPLSTGKHDFPNSPDMHWSIANDFKSSHYYDRDPSHRMRMKGGNYMNMVRAILVALGNIGSDSATDGVKKYLTHELPAVRAYAAQSLGNIGTVLELEQAYTSEQDTRVKVYMAYAILQNDKSKFTFYLDLTKFLKDNNDLVRFDCAVVLRDLAMGESEQILRAALFIEGRPIIRNILREGIYRTRVDNIMPVNY